MTPKWVNKEKIKKIYMRRKKWQEVDHIYPLKGKFAHGLHCSENMQLISKKENRKKSNKIDLNKVFKINDALDTKIKKIKFYHANDEFLTIFKNFCYKNNINYKVEYFNCLEKQYKNVIASPTIKITYKNKLRSFLFIGLNKYL